jgi:hypothetical protein
MGPNQKFGIESPRREKNSAERSIHVPCLRAASVASGNEMMMATIIAQRVSSNVAGNRAAMSLATSAFS